MLGKGLFIRSWAVRLTLDFIPNVMWSYLTCHSNIAFVQLGFCPLFILNDRLWSFLDSDIERLGGPASSLMEKTLLFPDCVAAALELSFWSWAFGPASFLIRNYVCFWTWMLEHGTCHSSVGLVTLILKERTHCFWTWMLGCWTCHYSIGLVILKLGLRPNFFLNERLLLFLDFDVGRWDLSLRHWTCHLEAGPSAQLHS